jgi:UMF1 family MFS transporter
MNTSREFFAMAVAVGLVQGGVQSLSRSMYGRLIPPGKNAEYFGFYNMMGKFATVFGPLLVGVVATLTHDTRLANASIVVLFLLGGGLLLRVPFTPRAA